MHFRSEIQFAPFSFLLNQKDAVFTIGSCFADVFSSYLSTHKMSVYSNPYGVVYNPISILDQLKSNEISRPVQKEGLWVDLNAHSEVFGNDKKQLETSIAEIKNKQEKFINNASMALITLGTSNVYIYKKDGCVVANNHKLPSQDFEKIQLSVQEVVLCISEIVHQLKSYQADLKIVFTISPVRHLKDGFVENMRSKAVLIAALHDYKNRFQNIDYLPVYELMMDDLRDYRFYKEDLIHPNHQAEQYIMEKVAKILFDAPTLVLHRELEEIKQSMLHKPFHIHSESHQKFLKLLQERMHRLSAQVDFSDEFEHLKRWIK